MTKKIYREKDTGHFASAEDEKERPDEITEETVTIASKEVIELLQELRSYFGRQPHNEVVESFYYRLNKILGEK